MKTAVFVLAFCVVLALGSKPNHGNMDEAIFEEWMTKHGKVYATDEEYQLRFANFKESVRRVAEKNAKSKTATFALNKFSDLSVSEFRAKYLMKKPVQNPIGGRSVVKPTKKVTALPDTFDWRDKKVVTPVKDQQQCGSCWAFSVVENIESVWMLAKNMTVDKMPALAPQQLVDCDSYDQGCNGGNPVLAYEYLMADGLEKESDYPYTGSDGTCNYKKPDVYATIKSWDWGTTWRNEETMRTNLVGVSPLSVCVDASNWQDYHSGVMGEWDCCSLCMLDHCVQLVGYNVQASSPYWIVRNSWGTDWGINGYIWVDFGHNTCGITNEATTAIVA